MKIKHTIFALTIFAFLVAPAHAQIWLYGGWASGPVVVHSPTFVSAAAFVPGPVIVSQPTFVSAAVFPPPLIVQNTPTVISVSVNAPPLVVQDTRASVNVAVNGPNIPTNPTTLPSVALLTNFRPQFGLSPRISISVPRRELPVAPFQGGELFFRLSTLEERFPACDVCGCTC